MTQSSFSTETADIGLHELAQRRPARVTRLLPAADADAETGEVLLRLLEIGFLPGEPVQVMARAFPGHDPVAVRVGHTTFALRRHEAALVRVSPLAAEGARA